MSGEEQIRISQYDPEVEFLEIGYQESGTQFWKIYGPDINGVYGGLQGIGGLEALVNASTGEVIGGLTLRKEHFVCSPG